MASLLSISCAATPPVRHHLLTARPVAAPVAGLGEAPALRVGPFAFPDYLNRPQMVFRDGNAVRIRERDRWAEPLPGQFLGVLRENLALRTGSARVYGPRWPGVAEVDFRLSGSVDRFEVDAAGEAALWVRWQIADRRGALVVAPRLSRHAASATPGDAADAASALGRTVAALSDEVAEALVGLARAAPH